MEFVKTIISDKEFINTIFSDNKLLALMLLMAFVGFFSKQVIEKFIRKIYPSIKSNQDIQCIREKQLNEVYLPLHKIVKKNIGLPSKSLDITFCKKLYIKATVIVGKYYVYIEDDIISRIYELGNDIKKHDTNSSSDTYQETAKKLINSINIEYLALKNILSYSTKTTLRNFRSLSLLDKAFEIASILYIPLAVIFYICLIIVYFDEQNFVAMCIAAICFIVWCIVIIIMLIYILKLVLKIFFRFIIKPAFYYLIKLTTK